MNNECTIIQMYCKIIAKPPAGGFFKTYLIVMAKTYNNIYFYDFNVSSPFKYFIYINTIFLKT